MNRRLGLWDQAVTINQQLLLGSFHVDVLLLKFGNDLARYMARQGVTYFSTVPTMLSTMTEPIPSLRQLVVSGEVCPPELVSRWAGPGPRPYRERNGVCGCV